MRTILKIFLILVLYTQCQAQTVSLVSRRTTTPSADTTNWYVSNDGNDSNTGHSTDAALQTIAGLETKTLQAGDSVFFNKGDIWYEDLTVSNAGTAGSPIVITSYGTGANPIISGAEILTTWVQNGNIWASAVSGTVYNFYVNGIQQTLARYPSTGNWFRVNEGTSTNKVVSDDLTGSSEDEYLGATLRIRSGAWKYDTPIINSSQDDSVSVATVLSYTPSNGYGFYMTGLPAFLDTCLEWYSDGDSIWYYPSSGIDPNEETCIASIREIGVAITGSYITVNGLQTEKQSVGIKATGTPQYLTVQNCIIKDQWTHGIHFTGAGSWHTITDNIITDVNACGINLYFSGNSTISGDSLDRIGIIPGLYSQPFGIIVRGDTSVISGNRLDSIGYSGIYPGSWDIVCDNVVCNTLLTLEDGGGIYSGGDASNHPTNVRIYNNIIENVIGYGTSTGTSYPNTTVGIYLDAFTDNSYVGNNTIKGTMQYGIFTQYTSMIDTINANTIYDIKSPAAATLYYQKSSGLYLLQSTNYANWGNLVVTNNTIFSSDTSAFLASTEQRCDTAEYIPMINNDYNKYLNPYDQNRMFLKSVYTISYGYMDLPTWQDTTTGDANAGSIWRHWYSSTQKDSLFVNKFNYPYTYTIAANTWKNYEGTIQGTSLTVPADSAILLFNSPDSDTLLAQYSETNQDADGLMSIANGTPARAQNFYGDGNYIYGFWAYVKRVGTSGYYKPALWSNTGAYGGTSRPYQSLQTGDTVLTSSYSTSYTWVYFSFTTPYLTKNGTIYHIVLSTWDASSSNCLTWGRDSSTPTYPGNPSYGGAGGTSWSAGSSDECFKVSTYGSGGAP